MNTIDILLTGMAYGGEAFGRDPDGRMVFVPFGLPDELVRIEIMDEHKRWSRAHLLEVLKPSSKRLEPRCHHFETCGGCHYQHISYQDQLEIKTQILRDQLKRIGGFDQPTILPMIPSPEAWYYRNRARFSLTEEGGLGYFDQSGSHVFEMQECHLPLPEVLDMLEVIDVPPTFVISAVEIRSGSDEDKLVVFHGEGDPEIEVSIALPDSIVWQGAGGSAVLAGNDYLFIKVMNRRFKISAGSFFQVNATLLDKLVNLVIETLNPSPEETIFDLYAGVGFFSAFISERGSQIIAVEESSSACLDFEHNLDDLNPVLYEAPVEVALSMIEDIPTAMVIDPPRSGISKEALDGILKFMPKRIVYVSCDPATLARDGKRLQQNQYDLVSIRPIDMFPQTFHIESVSLWHRSGSKS